MKGLRGFLRGSRGLSPQAEVQPEDVDPLRVLAQIPDRTPVGELVPRQRATAAGVVVAADCLESQNGVAFRAVVQDESGELAVLWQGRESVHGIEEGVVLSVAGTVSVAKRFPRMIDPAYTILEDGKP